MNRKNSIIGLVLLLLFLVGGVIYTATWQGNQDIGDPKKEVIKAITRDMPAFIHKDKPVIEIDSLKELDDVWLIATIKSVHEKKMTVPVKVVLLNQSSSEYDLQVILGPETHFTERELLQANIPDSVILELTKP